MPNVTENIGWIISADDLASGVVLKMEKTVEGVVKGVTVSTTQMVAKTEKSMQTFGASTQKMSKHAGFWGGEMGKYLSMLSTSAANLIPAEKHLKMMGQTLRKTQYEIKQLAFGKGQLEEYLNIAEQLEVPIEKVRDAFNKIRVETGKMRPSMEDLQEDAKKVGMAFSYFVEFVKQPQSLHKYRMAALDLGMSLDELKDYLEEARGTLSDMGDEANTASTKMSFLRGSMKGLKSVAKAGAGGLLAGAAFGLGFEGIQELFSFLKGTFQPFLEVIQGTVNATFAPLKKTFYDLATKIAPVLSAVLTPIVNILAGIVGQITEIIGSTTIFADVSSLILKTMEALAPVVSAIFTPLSAQLKNASGLIDIFGKLFADTLEQVTPIITMIAVGFRDLAMKFGPILVDVLKQVADLFVVLLADNVDLMKEMVTVTFELLEALMPMIPPLVKLVALVTKFTLIMNMKIMSSMVRVWLLLAKAIVAVVDPIAKVVGYLLDLANPAVEAYLTWMVGMFDGLVSVLKDLGEILWKVFVVYLKVMIAPFVLGFKAAVAVVTGLWTATKFLAGAWWEYQKILLKVLRFAISPLIIYGKILVGVYALLGKTFANVVTWLWKATGAATFFQNIVKGASIIVKGLGIALDFVLTKWQKAWGNITYLVRSSISVFKDVFGNFLTWFKHVTNTIVSFFGFGFAAAKQKMIDVLYALKTAITIPIDMMKRFINDNVIGLVNALLDIDLPVVGRIGDMLAKEYGVGRIPYLEKGGIVTSPTIAAVGEVPEVITPLTKEGISKFLGGVLPKMEVKEPGPVKLDKEALDMLRKAVALLEKIVDQGDSDGGDMAPVLEGL